MRPAVQELTQDQIREGLAAVLELGHPTAVYQLPQITRNEVSPESAARLAAAYPNFYLLKDTSGEDRIAQAGVDLAGVFLVRGAEGQYSRWLNTGGGPYDGFLLSSANCLSRELAAMMNHLATGDRPEADRLSSRLEQVVTGCFDIVRDYPVANPFTNANKILDHIMAYGGDARDACSAVSARWASTSRAVCGAGLRDRRAERSGTPARISALMICGTDFQVRPGIAADYCASDGARGGADVEIRPTVAATPVLVGLTSKSVQA